jgi:hypothetical protein
MSKAIYSLKMELLLEGNEGVMQLTSRELQGIQRFNRFVVGIYIESWFTCRSAVDAPVNDIRLIQKLMAFDDDGLKTAGLKAMKRHSWYLSPELANLALFSDKVSSEEKTLLVTNIRQDRGSHRLTSIPSSVSELQISRSFFTVLELDDSFLGVPVELWPETQSFVEASAAANHLACVNDCAERGVALIQDCNARAKDEVQKQYLLQVIEQHRRNFKGCSLNVLETDVELSFFMLQCSCSQTVQFCCSPGDGRLADNLRTPQCAVCCAMCIVQLCMQFVTCCCNNSVVLRHCCKLR